ncbi:MAG: FAD-dependent oxidoreductase, partial [Deltaproteobacteria bacterium]|nr:FAD-dependent oxidoreductase [Deltaproteobacteria bacterium]
RFIADLDLTAETKYIPQLKEKKHKKVAVIGAGPAGLTAAYYLAIEGYSVEVFEALPVAGGWMSVGIPDYRLPKDVLNAEIKIIEDMGVKIHLNTAVGKDVEFSKIKNDFDALFIGCGTHISSKLDIPGEDMQGVFHGIDYLKRVNLGEKVFLGKSVAVIGGGNVAMDAVRTAVRTGSQDVFILYRRSRAEMPASPEEIEEALEEGVRMEFLVAPKRILGENGKVTGVECVRMELGEPDASGRRRPVEVKGSEFIVKADAVVPAIGQSADLQFLSDSGIALSKWKTFDVDEVTFATNVAGIFAGGDAASGAATVVKAVNAGKEAAKSIDRYLQGEDVKAGRERDWKKNVAYKSDVSGYAKKMREKYPHRDPVERAKDFGEVGLGFSEAQAKAEALRCLSCGICSECYQCVDACLAKAIDHEDTFREEEIAVGAVIASPGFEIFDARLRGEYGFGVYENVVTSLQFERILSASGPYFGHVQRISDGKEPKKIAFIQCVGSRDTSCGNSWCSSVCCMYATKEAIIGKEHANGLEPTIFFMDIRAHGKDFDRFVNRAQNEYGIRYIRSIPSTIKELQQSKNLLLTYVLEDGSLVEEEFDMVVLSVGLTPPKQAKALAKALKVDLEEHGFCKTALENPVETTREGIFVCGAFGGPKDIPETVMEASSAAACASGLLADVRGTMVAAPELPEEKDLRGESVRIGAFICHCGINIGGVVNVPEVVEYTKTLPNVVFVTDNLFTCSQDTAVKMGEIIKEQNLTRVMVASCSPRTHEGLFQENCENAGLNRYLFEMANIRDQDSWVHMHEPEAATAKAKDLVRMAIHKAAFLKPLKPGQLPVDKAVLIIGGGLSGLTAALSFAQQGFAVHIVEKTGKLGGNYGNLHYTLEGLDVAKHLESLIAKVKQSGLISVYLNASIAKMEGYIGKYKTTVVTGRETKDFTHGVVVVATGAYEVETTEYLHGSSPAVISQRRLEELLAAGSNEIKGGKSLAMIQCVGSRTKERPYCSRYCCSEAIKNALKIKEIDPSADVTIFYRDIRTFGLKEDYYKKARELNVKFIRYDEGRKPEVTANGAGVTIKALDPVLNEVVEIKVDLLALSIGSVANPDNDAIGKMLKVPINQDGFFLEAHVKLRPVDFATDGVFVCGMAHSPKLSEDSIVQANAVVSRASTILTKEYLEAEGKTAYVNKERCSACGLCEANCPFSAISVDEIERVAVVNAVLCKGCGVCTASCRMNAVDLNGFSNEGVLAQIAVVA